MIINGNPYVSGYDPLTGKELWEVECMSGDVAPSVAVNSTMAYAVTDYAKLVAIKPANGVSIVWEDNTYTPDVSSPVATDQFLFVSTGNGDVACYNHLKEIHYGHIIFRIRFMLHLLLLMIWFIFLTEAV